MFPYPSQHENGGRQWQYQSQFTPPFGVEYGNHPGSGYAIPQEWIAGQSHTSAGAYDSQLALPFGLEYGNHPGSGYAIPQEWIAGQSAAAVPIGASSITPGIYDNHDYRPEYSHWVVPLPPGDYSQFGDAFTGHATSISQAGHPAAVQESPGCRIPCLWDGGCGHMYPDKPTAGMIKRHLREHHIRGEWHQKSEGVCKWYTEGKPCGKSLKHESLGKHVASVHLGALACFCNFCGDKFSRIDALTRHVRKWCRENPARV